MELLRVRRGGVAVVLALLGVVAVTSPTFGNAGPTVVGTTVRSDATMAGVGCASATACVALGGSGSSGWAQWTNDSGTTWHGASLPGGTGALSGVACLPSGHCAAVGRSASDSTSIVALHSADSGATWSPVAVPGSFAPGLIACAGTSTCAIATSAWVAGTQVTTLLRSANGGASWSVGGSFSGVWPDALACGDALHCAAVIVHPMSEDIVSTTDGGASWSLRATPADHQWLDRLSCAPAACFAVEKTTGATNVVLRSTDLGPSWSALPWPPDEPGPVACISIGCLMAAGSGPVRVLITADLGSTWSVGDHIGTLTDADGVVCPVTATCYVIGPSSGSTTAIVRLDLDATGVPLTSPPTTPPPGSTSPGTTSGTTAPGSPSTTAAATTSGGDGGSGATAPIGSLAPARLLDTRDGGSTIDHTFEGVGRRGAGATLALVVRGRGGVGADAAAVAINVTAVAPSADGYVTVYPCGAPRPLAANLNHRAGRTVGNATFSAIGVDGTICLFTHAATDLVVDVTASVPASPATPQPIVPARLYESRVGTDLATIDHVAEGAGRLGAGQTVVVPVRGRGGIRSDATAVVLNVTAVGPSAAGYVTVFPCGADRPTAASLNVEPGVTRGNGVVAALGPSGDVCVFTYAPLDLVVDAVAFVPAAAPITTFTPARLLDTRPDGGSTTIDHHAEHGGRLDAGSTTRLPVAGRGGVPVGARVVSLDITVVEPSSGGFVTAFACDDTRPNASNLNHDAGATVGNSATVAVAADGSVCLFTYAATHLVVDVAAAS